LTAALLERVKWYVGEIDCGKNELRLPHLKGLTKQPGRRNKKPANERGYFRWCWGTIAGGAECAFRRRKKRKEEVPKQSICEAVELRGQRPREAQKMSLVEGGSRKAQWSIQQVYERIF